MATEDTPDVIDVPLDLFPVKVGVNPPPVAEKGGAVHKPGHGQHDRTGMIEVMVFDIAGMAVGIETVKKSFDIRKNIREYNALKIRIHQGADIKNFLECRLRIGRIHQLHELKFLFHKFLLASSSLFVPK
jgi:hypothetical protein